MLHTNKVGIFFDVDGTLTAEKSTWQYLHKRLGTLQDAVRNKNLYKIGKISFVEWGILDASLWKNIKFERVKKILCSIPLTKDARGAVIELKNKGFIVGIISSTVSILTERLSRELSIDKSIANVLECKDGSLTGNVEMMVTDENKGSHFNKICEEYNISPDECVAVGDSQFDISMFKKAGFSIAFNPCDSLAEEEADVIVRGSLRNIIPTIENWLSSH